MNINMMNEDKCKCYPQQELSLEFHDLSRNLRWNLRKKLWLELRPCRTHMVGTFAEIKWNKHSSCSTIQFHVRRTTQGPLWPHRISQVPFHFRQYPRFIYIHLHSSTFIYLLYPTIAYSTIQHHMEFEASWTSATRPRGLSCWSLLASHPTTPRLPAVPTHLSHWHTGKGTHWK